MILFNSLNRMALPVVPAAFDRDRPALFLDVDGVLNSAAWVERRPPQVGNDERDDLDSIDPEAVARLNRIVEAANPLVVLSSSWRLHYSPAVMTTVLRERGFVSEVVGATRAGFIAERLRDPPGYPYHRTVYAVGDDGAPREWWSHRGDEIRSWRERAGHAGPFAILDDDGDMSDLGSHLVLTSYDIGLQDEHVERVLALLRRM